MRECATIFKEKVKYLRPIKSEKLAKSYCLEATMDFQYTEILNTNLLYIYKKNYPLGQTCTITHIEKFIHDMQDQWRRQKHRRRERQTGLLKRQYIFPKKYIN